MKSNLSTLFADLMKLCAESESFYFVDQVRNDVPYRVFTYRLASFTEFQLPNAIECRGHTFRYDKWNDSWVLASLPMAKFFNYGEHVGWGTEMDLNAMQLIMDKADGSLISTVIDEKGNIFLKSKTSFNSTQAKDAEKWCVDYSQKSSPKFVDALLNTGRRGYTVNMEWVSPDNQIVIGYAEPQLIVLNARNNSTGAYMPYKELMEIFGLEYVVPTWPIPVDGAAFLNDVANMTGIEGVIFQLPCGTMMKHKTDAYCVLHHLKDSINNPKRLWAACINETADDLRALFKDDPISIERITAMEAKASQNFNRIDKLVNDFYNENKDLDRKSYAILNKKLLEPEGLFSLAMNLYIGRDSNIKTHMIKNYKDYGISDIEESTDDN